jgi:signal transduction histidine kinase
VEPHLVGHGRLDRPSARPAQPDRPPYRRGVDRLAALGDLDQAAAAQVRRCLAHEVHVRAEAVVAADDARPRQDYLPVGLPRLASGRAPGEDRAMSRARPGAIVLAALLCGAGAAALILSSNHLEAKLVWAVFGPLVGWSFIGTGLYAQRRRPDSRAGALMVLLGFAWFANAISTADSALLYTVGNVTGGLWGGVFLHLIMTFPSGRLRDARDRSLVIAGYVIFTLANVPSLLFAAPADLGCDDCPTNLLLIERHEGLADAMFALQALLYAGLFVMVLVRLARRWRRTPILERLQLTPVYASGLLTFLLVTVAVSGGGDSAIWPAFAATAVLPFAFLGGLLRSHVARLDADLRASRLRLVEAGDTERRRLERNLHDGAQARLVALALQLGHARRVAEKDPGQVPELLDGAMDELRTSLAELRELAPAIHPAVLSEKGLAAALYALAARAPLPVTLETDNDGRLPEPVEVAAYYAVSEALTNVAKYARATSANVSVHRLNGSVLVDVVDDGVGGADAARGSGLRGLADRVAALDGTLSVESPPGRGTRLHVEIPVGP